MMEAKTLQQAAQEAADQIRGKTIAEAFNDGPRRLFVEHQVPKHGTYRLYIARPFGVRKPGGQRWRIQITVQYQGSDREQEINSGHVIVPYAYLSGVIMGAADQMAEHIKANRQTLHQARRAAMQAVRAPGAVSVDAAGGA